MDFLIRWPCPSTSNTPCLLCAGKGYVERWVRSDVLPEVEQILGRGWVVRRDLDKRSSVNVSRQTAVKSRLRDAV